MSKFLYDKTGVCNVICAVLLAVLLVFQFMPFWHMGDDAEDVSINAYVWFPEDHKDLKTYLSDQTGEDCSADNVLAMPLIVLVAGFAGIILGIIKRDNMWIGCLPALAGGVGVWGYLTKPAFQLGANWQLHLALCVVILVVALAGIASGAMELKEERG